MLYTGRVASITAYQSDRPEPKSKLPQMHDAREASDPDSSAESVFLLPALPFRIGLAVNWVGGSGGPAPSHRPRDRCSRHVRWFMVS